jgi:hypothetical protein
MAQLKGVPILLCAAVLMGGMLSTSAVPMTAQEATPVVENQVGGQFVTIHTGACDTLGEAPAFEVGAAFLPGTDDEDSEGNELRGSRAAVPVLVAEATIDSDFGEVLDDAEHALVVHASESDLQTIEACGALGGVVVDGRLVVGLTPVNDSGLQGIAVVDEDEDELNVKVYLLAEQAMSEEEEAGGMATPAE